MQADPVSDDMITMFEEQGHDSSRRVCITDHTQVFAVVLAQLHLLRQLLAVQG